MTRTERPPQMTPEEIAAAPRHPQLMDPAGDPEELIASSIWWYPLISPTRTEVLEHLLLGNGNGYEWSTDGKLRSVFSHIEPDYDRLESRYEEYQSPPWTELAPDLAARERERLAAELETRARYRELARTYGPVRTRDDFGSRAITPLSYRQYTLLGRAPQDVAPAWRPVLEEARLLFACLLASPEAQELKTTGHERRRTAMMSLAERIRRHQVTMEAVPVPPGDGEWQVTLRYPGLGEATAAEVTLPYWTHREARLEDVLDSYLDDARLDRDYPTFDRYAAIHAPEEADSRAAQDRWQEAYAVTARFTAWLEQVAQRGGDPVAAWLDETGC